MRGKQLGERIRRTKQVKVSPREAAIIHALRMQQRLTSYSYYTKVRFIFVELVPGTHTYTLAKGTKVRGFGYGRGTSMEVAGFTAFDGVGSPSETNLTDANKTISGQNVVIHGIAAQLMDAALIKRSIADTVPVLRLLDFHSAAGLVAGMSISIAMNGAENNIQMGILPMIPGAGGLAGGASDISGNQTGLAGTPNRLDFGANGWQVSSNFHRVPEGVVWRHTGAVDSQLNLVCEVQRDIVVIAGGSIENGPLANIVANNAFDSVATGVARFVWPTELVVDVMFHLKGEVISDRTTLT